MADDDLVDDWKKEQPNDKRLAKTYFTSIVNPENKQTYTYYSPVYTPIMAGQALPPAHPHRPQR